MKSIYNKVRSKSQIFKNLGFLQKMVVVYVIGAIIPLLGTSVYTNFQTRKMMIDLSKETQTEEISLLRSSIGESMTVLDNVARLLCLNEQIQNLATKTYSNKTEFMTDYYNTSTITEYLNNYKQDISYINVYIKNDSVTPGNLKKVENISYLSTAEKETNWYKRTIHIKDAGYWSYGIDPKENRQSIQITRAMRDDTGRVIAVVRILMQYKKTIDAISERAVDTMILYNSDKVVSSNYNVFRDYPFLIDNLRDIEETSASEKMTYGVEEYLVTYERIKPNGSADYYSLVSIQKYQDIMANVNKISMWAFLPEVIGMVLSSLLIVSFSLSYGWRINQLRIQMTRVAQGEYDLVEPIEGNDEIAEIYQELEQMMQDIKKLMNDVVTEQVQKEKLHTRQKEVEFKMLASQINPHFLYNTLETIRMKAMVNKQPEIAELVMMLAKTMRYNIQVADQLVTLKAELQMVEYYLRIQEYRFGDRISSQVRVEPDVDMNASVLPLIIQPFVENAYIHGLEGKEEDGRLEIYLCMCDGDIYIIISDNGAGMDYYELGELRQSFTKDGLDKTHIGMCNVNQRIKILYGRKYGIQVYSKQNVGTKVTIRIPYQLKRDEDI